MIADERSIGTLERALSLLDAFRTEDRSLSLAELSDRTGINKATILRLAANLERFAYLARTAGGEFRIGPKPLHLGAQYQRWTQPSEIILPALEKLVAETGESASYMVRQQGVRMCVFRLNSPHSVRAQLRPGEVFPMDRGAAGKVILAFTKPHDPAFARIRRDGICVTHGEVTPDVAAIAAPVFAGSEEIVGALSVSGPQYRFDRKAIDRARGPLSEGARFLSIALAED